MEAVDTGLNLLEFTMHEKKVKKVKAVTARVSLVALRLTKRLLRRCATR